MGRATRWLKGIFFGGNGEKKNNRTISDVDKLSSATEKKVWSFARSFRDKEGGGGGWGWRKDMTRSFHGSDVVKPSSASPVVVVMGNTAEQSKRAIAVAAATTAAAEAAVAAAQAAAVVVKLTSTRGSLAYGWKREAWATIKIQAVFRGYLARRALKALRGLVKLQALVRGHIVRKQAVETLRCMQALVRAQSRVRAGRTPNKGSNSKNTNAPSAQEKYELTDVRSENLEKCASKTRQINAIDPNLLQSSGWSWLDRWMEERYWDSREAASRTGTVTDDEKILEIDSGNPHLNCKWKNNHHHSVHPSEQNRLCHVTMHDSPSKDSTLTQYSVPCPASVTMAEPTSSLGFSTEAADVSESPQYYTASSRTGISMKGPFTPSKSECSLSYLSEFSDYPNYMSNTESFKAKVRSHSAPRQRPAEYEKSSSVKRSSGYGHVSGELSSSASQRSCLHAKFTNKAYTGSGRLDRLGMPHGR